MSGGDPIVIGPSPIGTALRLGLAHGAVDLAGGLLLGTVARGGDAWALALLFGFDALASAGQLVVERSLAQRVPLRSVVAIAVLATAAALALLPWAAPLAVVLGGAAAAVFHVAAGAWALRLPGGGATAVGLFSAPGIAGLGLGVSAGLSSVPLAWPAIGLLAVAAIVITQTWPAPAIDRPRGVAARSPASAWLVGLLLVGASARACAWNGLDWLAAATGLAVPVALAAAVGKLLGGALADRLGPRRFVALALSLGACSWWLAGAELGLLVTAMLLMSVVPASYVLALRVLPRATLAAAVIGGASLLLGALPWLAFDGAWLTTPLAATLLLAVATAGLCAAPPAPLSATVPSR